jgi:hypothetical protein
MMDETARRKRGLEESFNRTRNTPAIRNGFRVRLARASLT